ncbi:hypothetical protein Droror1_Dr00015120 [Drosera rotundifolia]
MLLFQETAQPPIASVLAIGTPLQGQPSPWLSLKQYVQKTSYGLVLPSKKGGKLLQVKASQDQVVVRAVEDKFANFKDELKQRMKTAPNYATLSKKLNMLRDASKLTSIQELEYEMKKLEEQVLKATDTPYEASVSNLDKLIEKLQMETVNYDSSQL